MTIDELITDIGKELTSLVDPDYQSGQYKFHSKEFKLLGVKTNNVRKIISQTYKEIKGWNEKEVYILLESLLEKQFNEYKIISFGLALKYTKKFTDVHFTIYESWIEKYVIDWAQCDDLCGGVLGKCISEKPEFTSKVISWTNSKNVWFRRAAAVSLIYSLRKGKYLKESIIIADKLLLDDQDMVQKGYGWMLKVGSKNFQEEVFNFVMERKETMPRTALRYAIEKMPADLKKKAMAK